MRNPLYLLVILFSSNATAQSNSVQYFAKGHTITIDWEKSVSITNDDGKTLLFAKWVKTMHPELPKIITDPEEFKKMFGGQSGTLPVMEMTMVAILNTKKEHELVTLNMFIETIDITVTGENTVTSYSMKPAFDYFEIQKDNR